MCILRRALVLSLSFALLTYGQGNTSTKVGYNAGSVSTSGPVAPTDTAQDTPAQTTATATTDTKTELSIQDTGTTFKLRVNLVQVHVMVRDSKGKPVEGLKREDFQLYDKGKLQMISTFGVETPKTRLERAEAEAKTPQGTSAGEGGGEKVLLPQRFVALMFDDIHLKTLDAMVVRASAKALIDNLPETDRLAIYSTSGNAAQEFTADKAALEKISLKIVPHPGNIPDCPEVTYYIADLALDKGDPTVFPVVFEETWDCMYHKDPMEMDAASYSAGAALQYAFEVGDRDNANTFSALGAVIRRMQGLPGERVLVLASPGFTMSRIRQREEAQLIEQANRAGVVINALDARGLYVPDLFGDISLPAIALPGPLVGMKAEYQRSEQPANQLLLDDFATGTGGTFFRNSNDLSGGLKNAGLASEITYVLGFSPQNQKMDGKYHNLRVTLTNKQKYTIQARKGYYAPKRLDDSEQQAKQEIADAVFSREEIHDMPLELQTQYFTTGDTEAHLSVVSHIDIKGLHFRKAEGRNWDNLTVATVIFDENGNFVTGGEKLFKMRLMDSTYVKLSQTGVTMKSSFDVKPGKYMIRQVVRDSEGAQMAARTGAVVVPYSAPQIAASPSSIQQEQEQTTQIQYASVRPRINEPDDQLLKGIPELDTLKPAADRPLPPSLLQPAGELVDTLSASDLARPGGSNLATTPENIALNYYAGVHPYLELPFDQLVKRIPELEKIQPATDQEAMRAILKKTGNNVDGYFSNLVDLIAREKITLKRSSDKGFSDPAHVKDNYLILKKPHKTGYEIVEYRMDDAGHNLDNIGTHLGFAATRGFALMSQFFASSLQRESVFRYLGDQKIGSRDSYVVGFAQKPGSATMLVGVRTREGIDFPMLIQGIAWIDKRDLQIIRIRTDLLAPRPDLALEYQTTEITFSEVRLVDVPTPLWLPKDVTVKAEFKGHSTVLGIGSLTFRNKHHYSDYRRYRVSVKMLPAQ
jgi:VWFA-related protein